MDFRYSDEHKMLRRAVRSFCDAYIRPFSKDWDKEAKFPTEIIPVMGSMGYLGPTVPEQFGGMNLDFISYAILNEEINAADSSIRTLITVHTGLVSSTINQWGTEEQKSYFLPKLASGEMIGCFGLTESEAGSWVVNMQTKAVDDGDSIIVNGTKTWISNGQLAGMSLSFAQMDPQKKHSGIVAFMVEMGTPGFSIGQDLPKMGARANHAVELVFEDCRIPKRNILGTIGNGFKVAMSALDFGRYSVASGSVGLAQECLNLASEYAKQRITFGKPIAEHQMIKQKIARMATDIDAARLLVYRAGYLKDQGLRSTRETSMAKWFATEIANRAAYECLQIYGANGYSSEFPIEKIFRDIRVTTIYEGTSEIQQLIIAGYALGFTKDQPLPGYSVMEQGEIA